MGCNLISPNNNNLHYIAVFVRKQTAVPAPTPPNAVGKSFGRQLHGIVVVKMPARPDHMQYPAHAKACAVYPY